MNAQQQIVQQFTFSSILHDMLHQLAGRPVEDIMIGVMVAVIVFAWYQIIWH